jgi:hypothetical protein
MTKTAFLSSTAKDLAEYREAVYGGIQRMDGWKCIRMEDFGARDNTPDEFCRAQVAACDVFVGVVGHLYGSSPPCSDESFTEREYNAAAQAGRPRFIFVAPDDFPLSATLRETDEKSRKQKAFRHRVTAERIRASFQSPEDLALAVVTALRNWELAPNAAQPETAAIASLEAPEKILAGLNTQSFFAMSGEPPASYRAADYISLIAVPRSIKALRLDQTAQERFEQMVTFAFPEIRGFDLAIPRGQYYQVQSHVPSRSSTHRVWCLWNCGAVGYTANLEQSHALPVGDLVLHYIFFWRLCELVLGPSGEVVVDALLVCPHARFTAHFPDPHGSRSDYDYVSGIRFDERHPYVREQIQRIEKFHLPVEDIAQKLADLVFFQIQETAAARIDFEKWLEAITNLLRQTGFGNWGKLR